LHTDKEAAAVTFPARPVLDIGVDLIPSAQVEKANAKVRAGREAEGFLKRGKELLLDVIENAGHLRAL